MRVVVQRVLRASVSVEDRAVSGIGRGLLVLAAAGASDTENDLRYLSGKIARMRIFPDGAKESSLSVRDIGGEILLVSQFTLYGDMRKGNRPSFSDAMPAEKARGFLGKFRDTLVEEGLSVKTGVFQAMMTVSLDNDGPYTIVIDSKSEQG